LSRVFEQSSFLGTKRRAENSIGTPKESHSRIVWDRFFSSKESNYSMVIDLPLFCWITLGLLVTAGLLHLLPYVGRSRKGVLDACCKAPLLDLIVCYFTILPLIIGPLVSGWAGLISATFAQLATLLIWQTIHEAVHRDAAKGPRIIKILNKKFGAVSNLTAVYITGFAIPIFWLVRMAELILYPPLIKLVNLPAYNAGDWISVSRQKFSGLVGHDLIWCLYCDWMTGVWSLGSEMLRNVESFWCPIRFSCEKKCANCAIDFPDVNNGWVPASGTMGDVVKTLDRMYPPAKEVQSWFGHPLRRAHPPILAAKSTTKANEVSAT
jgi:hypothetical protein